MGLTAKALQVVFRALYCASLRVRSLCCDRVVQGGFQELARLDIVVGISGHVLVYCVGCVLARECLSVAGIHGQRRLKFGSAYHLLGTTSLFSLYLMLLKHRMMLEYCIHDLYVCRHR